MEITNEMQQELTMLNHAIAGKLGSELDLSGLLSDDLNELLSKDDSVLKQGD